MTFPLTDNVHLHGEPESTTAPSAPTEAQRKLWKARAEGRRKKEFPEKLALAFPLHTWTIDPEDSYYRQVGRHLVSIALRHLNERRQKLTIFELHALVGDDRIGKQISRQWLSAVMEAESHQELRELMHGDDNGLTVASLKQKHLEDYLWEYVMDNKPYGFLSDYDDVGQSKGFSLAAVERMTQSAAVFALDVWDADFKTKLSVAGRKGGKTSKRKPKHSLEGLEHLSITEQAKALGVTERTISRYRKQALTDKPQERAEQESEPVSTKPEVYLPGATAEPVPPKPRRRSYSVAFPKTRHYERDDWDQIMNGDSTTPVDNARCVPDDDLTAWADELTL
ncbi:hypothetical protein EDF46_0333 [Frondihabitans sp. PhB188]|uniref:hypothetical protein n=1 Tax=Frondihabitans sp. PhB188 TaxID=2485200 RepID=UPI000FBD92CB|nr:hypothetical protein [Frondihabitans sp. PhB188]ROQ40967.1 hypothetical protein EDF46_0333 [Frondihabitans sp. PhB188]